VGVLRLSLNAGDLIEVGGRRIAAQEAIAPGHKIALLPIAQGSPVFKYGEIIANATCDISPGDWARTHNTAPDFSGREYEYATRAPAPEIFPSEQSPTFMGYQRENGAITSPSSQPPIARAMSWRASPSNCATSVRRRTV
ncbi:MAG: UxaA family hydrolase, partial [Chloracidobacterium sp.]|nr:UxaA family hydrolase [Chloracidobacterium sp.]